jgi:hypothetical protein
MHLASELCQPPRRARKGTREETTKEGGEAPKDACHPLSAPHSRMSPSESAGRGRALNGARSPSGASPRRLSRRANARTQPRPRFTRARGRRRYPRRHPRLSEAPRTPVLMPEGTMPGPPGSGLQHPPAGTAPAPCSGVPREHDPLGERDSTDLVLDLRTDVNERVTLLSVMARLVQGHSRSYYRRLQKTWMPGTRPGMTNREPVMPRATRERLRFKADATLRYRVLESGGPLDEATANKADDPCAAFSKWSNEADEKAYCDL